MDVSGRRVVVFDWDGTVADTLLGITSAAREVLLGFGLAEEELGDLRRLIGPPFPQAYSQVYGLSDEDAMEVTLRYRERYAQGGAGDWPVFAGMCELLAELRASGRLLALASAKRHELVMRQAGDNDVIDSFDAIVGKMSDTATTKEGAIAQALELIGASPGEAVMVGDRDLDVWAAGSLGLPCVGVLYGGTGSRDELEGAGAVAIADTISDLRLILLG